MPFANRQRLFFWMATIVGGVLGGALYTGVFESERRTTQAVAGGAFQMMNDLQFAAGTAGEGSGVSVVCPGPYALACHY